MALTSAILREMFSRSSDEAFLLLATVTHETMPEPWRIVNNTEPIISRGMRFDPLPFSFQLPDDLADRPAEMVFAIDNSLLPLVGPVRSITTPAALVVELIAASKPDETIETVSDLILRSVEWDAAQMTFRASHEDFFNSRFPADYFVPREYAGIF